MKYGEYGVSHTESCHKRKTYYLTESSKNMELHNKYLELIAK
nr:MAG TPA: hypothetical protein [Bacteriophage sp.]